MFFNNFEKYDIPVLDLGVKLPKFIIEKKYIEKYNLPDNCTDYQFLLALCLQGLDYKIGKSNPRYNEYRDRMKYELDTLNELGFCSYLLITWDIVNYCKENQIATGFARGSSAGSVVLYLIDVTKIDSLKYGLFFERFLSKTRAKFKEKNGIKYYDGGLLMDIDLDIAHTKRAELITWLEKKYQGRIAKLPTVSTLTSKVLLKEVSKSYLRINEEKANEISESIPTLFGKVFDIDKAIKESPSFKEFAEENPEVIKISKRLYELVKHFGVHASAWIISADELDTIAPCQLAKDNKIVTSYTMNDALNLVIKLDLLGLRCATLIDKVCQMVNLKMEDIDINDPLIYDNLKNLNTPKGLFQIEADCNYGVLKKIKPRNIEHLAAIVALARPGTLQFVDIFSKYIETGEFQSIHAFFDDVLGDTAGIPIYQESLMRMANKIGFTLEQAEMLRRIVGKKMVEEMAEWEEKINHKIEENKFNPEIGQILWKSLDAAKDYSFNKCLSLDTIIQTRNKSKRMSKIRKGEEIMAYDINKNKDIFVKVKEIYKNKIELYEIELEDGKKIKASLDHKFLCQDKKFRTLKQIIFYKYKIMSHS